MKKRINIVFLLTIIYLASCQSNYSQYLNTNSLISYNEIKQPGIQLGACQAGLTESKAEYELMNTLGVEWIRSAFFWSKMEKEPGVWDFTFYDKLILEAEKYNKKVLIILTYDVSWIHKEGEKGRNVTPQNLKYYLNYVKIVAERYGDRAAGFEIWNEPNTPMFWKGSDSDFFELTKRTTELLKQIVPDKPVAVGSIFYHPIMFGKSYLKKMIVSGALNYADAVSLHPYGLSLTASAKRVAAADKLIKDYGYDKEIWITEIGVTTGGWYPNKTTVPKQANAVIKAITRLSVAGADLITWFKLLDGQMPEDIIPGISSEEFFGLAYPDFSLKPSGLSYSLIAKAIHGSRYIPDGISLIDISNKKLESYRFDKDKSYTSLVLWSNGSEVTIDILGYKAQFTIINLLTGKQTVYVYGDPIIIDSDPVLITGKLLDQKIPLALSIFL
jgi:polysaccharide biosynthesis protein PslG